MVGRYAALLENEIQLHRLSALVPAAPKNKRLRTIRRPTRYRSPVSDFVNGTLTTQLRTALVELTCRLANISAYTYIDVWHLAAFDCESSLSRTGLIYERFSRASRFKPSL